MAMFEVEKMKTMDLENCETTSSVMVKAKSIDDFKAVGCKQNEELASPPLPEKSLLKKITTLAIDKSLNIVVGLIVASVAAVIIYK